MNVSDAFHRYAEKVCEQIRWKKAHSAVAQEIEDHLTDQKNAYLAAGDSESIAEEKALLQMGDPVSVGAALDQTHKPAPQWGMIGLVLLLFVLGGIIQVLLLKTIPAGDDAFAARSAQVLFVFLPLSLAAFVGMYFLDFSFFGKHPYVLPLCLLLFDVIARMFGLDYGGQKWLSIGLLGLNISPSAISMLFPLAFCGLFYRLRSQGRRGYLISGVLAVVFCLFLSYCHTFSGVVTFVFSAGILMLIAAKKEWFGKKNQTILLLLFLLAVVCLIVLLMFYAPFRYRYGWERLYTIFVPSGDPMGSGYLSTQLKTILSHCVLLGEGAALSETQSLSADRCLYASLRLSSGLSDLSLWLGCLGHCGSAVGSLSRAWLPQSAETEKHFRADGFSDDSLHLHSGNPALYSGKSGYMAHRTDCPALPFLWGNGFAHQYGIGRRTAFCIPHG